MKKSKVRPPIYGSATVTPVGSIGHMYVNGIDFSRPIPRPEGIYFPTVVVFQEPYVFELDNLARKGEVTVFVRHEPNKTLDQVEQEALEQAAVFIGELSQRNFPR